jgi:polyribonucleotide nucleotidyltransferase
MHTTHMYMRVLQLCVQVAGNKDAITTFQLDIKCEGLTIALLEKALEQVLYIHILYIHIVYMNIIDSPTSIPLNYIIALS